MIRPLASAARARNLAGAGLVAAAVAALLAGRLAVAVTAGLVALALYHDLRQLLAPWGHLLTFVLGALGVGGFMWVGYEGDLELVPAVGAALTVALVVTRVFLYEAGHESGGRAGAGAASSKPTGITADVAATLAAAAVAGVGGAHVLLIRSIPRFGFRGLLAFVLMVAAAEIAAASVGRWRSRRLILPMGSASPARRLTWEGAGAGIAASAITGLMVGAAAGRPFSAVSGLVFGVGVGVSTLLGVLAFAVIRHSGRAYEPVRTTRAGFVDLAGSAIFAAPAFYWAFRTIAL